MQININLRKKNININTEFNYESLKNDGWDLSLEILHDLKEFLIYAKDFIQKTDKKNIENLINYIDYLESKIIENEKVRL